MKNKDSFPMPDVFMDDIGLETLQDLHDKISCFIEQCNSVIHNPYASMTCNISYDVSLTYKNLIINIERIDNESFSIKEKDIAFFISGIIEKMVEDYEFDFMSHGIRLFLEIKDSIVSRVDENGMGCGGTYGTNIRFYADFKEVQLAI